LTPPNDILSTITRSLTDRCQDVVCSLFSPVIQSTSPFAELVVSIGLLFLPPPLLIPRPSALRENTRPSPSPKGSSISQCGPVGGKAHRLDYAAHEVSLPLVLFGLGHDLGMHVLWSASAPSGQV